MNRCEALRRVLFLKGLPDAAILHLANIGHERCLEQNETLFAESSHCLGLIVVLHGAVKVFKTDAREREVILGVARPGMSVGDLPLFDQGNYPARGEALESPTVVYIVPPDAFARATTAYPEIAQGIIRALAVEQRKLIEMLKAQALHSTRARIAAYLLHAAGDRNTFALRETNAAIGSHVGTVREVVSRTLHSFEDLGAIRLEGRTVTLLDRTALHQWADATILP